MTYVTEILADESGIQYQGVKDKTGSTGTYPITGLITGKFRRGRFDKPMTITNANIRAMLGYDPKNPSYTAVQDALNSGVPSVQVLRVEGGSGGDNGWSNVKCPNGYMCYAELNIFVDDLSGMNQVYIPIALTNNGPSITQPFTVDFSSPTAYFAIAETLNNQLEPYGLYAQTNINHSRIVQIGYPYNRPQDPITSIKKFYILNNGNTFSSEALPRGLPGISCFYVS